MDRETLLHAIQSFGSSEHESDWVRAKLIYFRANGTPVEVIETEPSSSSPVLEDAA